MTDRAALPPGATVVVLHPGVRRATASAGSRAAGRLDPEQIKSILALRLAGRNVPPAVLEYALQEACRLIEEGLPAPSEPR